MFWSVLLPTLFIAFFVVLPIALILKLIVSAINYFNRGIDKDYYKEEYEEKCDAEYKDE